MRTELFHLSFFMEAGYDVVIMGGALAGAGMGLLLKRAMPEARILIVERSAEFDFKVGESTSEIAGCFLTRILRLGSWLSREQIAKNGLRFWFTTPDNDRFERCSEIGPKLQVRLPAWQLDRSKLDPHVLGLAEEAGCEVWRPAVVKDFTLEDTDGGNTVTIQKDGGTFTVKAKWIVDASGKAAVIARKRGTLKTLDEHPTSAMWARFRNLGDLDDHRLAAKFPCFSERVWSQRANATNHLTGPGWWAWIIPLQGGEVSVGLTWDRRVFTPPPDGPIPQRLVTVLRAHPVGEFLLKNAEPVERDARLYSQLAYHSTEVMGNTWAAVGDAAGFMDPLYSHGIDYVGNTVWAVHKIILASLLGENVEARVAWYRKHYQESYRRWFEGLYKDKYHYIGDAELMTAALLLDVGCYFIGPVRLAYMNFEEELSMLPYHGPVGAWFGKFMAFYNRRLARIGRARMERGDFGRKNLDHHHIFRESFMPSYAVRKLIWRGLKIWLRCELSLLRKPRSARRTLPAASATAPVSPPPPESAPASVSADA